MSAQVPKKMWPNHKYGHIWLYNGQNIIFCKLYKQGIKIDISALQNHIPSIDTCNRVMDECPGTKKMRPNHKYGHILPYNGPNIKFCKLYKLGIKIDISALPNHTLSIATCNRVMVECPGTKKNVAKP